MSVDHEFHPKCVMIVPTVIVEESECDCCDHAGPLVITFTWLVWSLYLIFGVEEDES